MSTDSSSANSPPLEAVLSALDRLAGDLRLRAEAAERRAEAAESQIDLEREARLSAEARAAQCDQSARDMLRRAEAMEAAVQDRIERLRHDLLDAIGEAVTAARGTTAAHQSRPPDDAGRFAAERQERVPPLKLGPELAHIPQPAAGRMSGSSEPSPRKWGEERGYAWVEDEPGPSWWSRLFRRY
ncbi:hypothetical protein [Paracraurococcus lichenis]|uniref:Uncharacterized protein n=1 Tax=Paracraurococcus lichenis TaxID=3064888 RepID=A0ABT9E317_9PROT|nr:hypothetical protein [Paracraurococcus sp. LOR1-02]MDO9710560.1 hypothetical protein [Paracraurococcus sp. LOR1-02]